MELGIRWYGDSAYYILFILVYYVFIWYNNELVTWEPQRIKGERPSDHLEWSTWFFFRIPSLYPVIKTSTTYMCIAFVDHLISPWRKKYIYIYAFPSLLMCTCEDTQHFSEKWSCVQIWWYLAINESANTLHLLPSVMLIYSIIRLSIYSLLRFQLFTIIPKK